jgi:hypothetical protein
MLPESSAPAKKQASEVEQPGLSRLREAVANAAESGLPSRARLKDALAGLNTAISNVPDGLAAGILAGVNPLYGLYTGNGQLYLTGIGKEAYELLRRADKLRQSGSVRVYEATQIVGESTRQAIADARAWLVRQNEENRDTKGAAAQAGKGRENKTGA